MVDGNTDTGNYRRLIKITSQLLDSDITNKGNNLFTLMKDICKFVVIRDDNDINIDNVDFDELIENTIKLLRKFNDMKKVDSSNINMVGYLPDSNRLLVEFKSSDIINSIYLYKNVNEKVYNEFLSAGSKGSYFHKYIRGKYECVRII